MTTFFLSFVDRSIAASFVILAVVAARALTRRSPKWTRGILWALVAIRLILPFTLHSAVSLVPELPQLSVESVEAQPDTPTVIDPITQVPPVTADLAPTGAAVPDAGITVDAPISVPIDGAVSNRVPDESAGQEPVHAEAVPDTVPGVDAAGIAAIVWLIGAGVLMLYGIASYVRLRIRVRCATRTASGIWQCERITSAFVLGVIRPRIYLPYHVDQTSAEHMIAHERAHIRRADHITKLFAFLLLAVYWFNPAVWLAYLLFCRDIELACDERAIRAIEPSRVQEYTRALLECSINRRSIAAYPISFGEMSVKARIKNILNYKKPTVWAIAAAVVVCVITAACFATAPIAEDRDSTDAPTQETTDSTADAPTEAPTEPTPDHTGEALFAYDAAAVRSVEISWQQDTERTARLSAAEGQIADLTRFASSLRYCAPADAQSALAGLTVTLTYEDEHTEVRDLGTTTLDGVEYAVCAQEETEFFTVLREELGVYLAADGENDAKSAYTFLLLKLDPADTLEWEETSVTVQREGMWGRKIDRTQCTIFSLTCGQTEYLLISSGALYDLQKDVFSEENYESTKPTVYEPEPEPGPVTEPEPEPDPAPEPDADSDPDSDEWVPHPAGSTRYTIQPRTTVPQGGTKVEFTLDKSLGAQRGDFWKNSRVDYMTVPILETDVYDTKTVAICIAETREEYLLVNDCIYAMPSTWNGNGRDYHDIYDEAYFEDHALIFMSGYDPYYITIDVTDVMKVGSELCIGAQTVAERSGWSPVKLCAISYPSAAIEIDKSVLDGVDTVSFYITPSNPPFPFKLRYDHESELSDSVQVEFTLVYNDKGRCKNSDFHLAPRIIGAPEDKWGGPWQEFYPCIAFSVDDLVQAGVSGWLGAKYDDAYFEDHAIIMLQYWEYENLKVQFDGICRTDTELCVEVSVDCCDNTSYRNKHYDYLIAIEVDRSAFDGVTDFGCYAKLRNYYETYPSQPAE